MFTSFRDRQARAPLAVAISLVAVPLALGTAISAQAAAGDPSGTPAGHAIADTQYTVVGEDSQQTSSGDGSAAAAFDGSDSTQWASAYSPTAAAYPHWLTFDVGGSFTLTGLGYSVKDQTNGPVQDVKVFTTDDAAVAADATSASWSAAGAASFHQPSPAQYQGAVSTEIQYVTFATPVKARYVKFEMDDAVAGAGNENASAAEVVAYSTDTDTDPVPPANGGTPPDTGTSPYSVHVDSVDSNDWQYPDDTPASLFLDKDGTFHFAEADASYAKSDPRQWSFFTGTTIDDAAPDTALDRAGTNGDTTALCNASPTGKTATTAPKGSGYAEANYCDLTQVWVDPDTGDWYGLVHNEFTPQPFGDGLHYDAIDYAVSTDGGRTWKITGHAITSPYSTTRGDTAAFPQQTYYYGDGDPRMYVDNASGYFYVFYGSRIVNKSGSWVAFYEHVARAPISAKMATGSWQKWYDGAWTQPGVGGKESNMTPVTDSSPTGYTAPAQEYDPKTPGTAEQQIAQGKMPPTSPLFVMDVTYDAYLGLYIGEPQNPDQSGNAPQELYATKDLATQKWFRLGDTGAAYRTASWYRWFVDPASRTGTAVVGKSFRSYCSFGCANGADAQFANLTVDSADTASAVDTSRTYSIASGAGRVLAASGGARVTGQSPAGSTAQAWTFHAVGDGSYTIAAHDGALLGVDSSKASARAWGTGLTATTGAATVGQEWFVLPVTAAGSPGAVRLVNRYSGLVIGIDGGSAQTVASRSWDKKAQGAGGLDRVAAQLVTLKPVAANGSGHGGQPGNGGKPGQGGKTGHGGKPGHGGGSGQGGSGGGGHANPGGGSHPGRGCGAPRPL